MQRKRVECGVQEEEFRLTGTSIDLGNLLKVQFAMSGGEAKHRIQDGTVTVNGETEVRRRRKIRAGDEVQLLGWDGVLRVVASETSEES